MHGVLLLTLGWLGLTVLHLLRLLTLLFGVDFSLHFFLLGRFGRLLVLDELLLLPEVPHFSELDFK